MSQQYIRITKDLQDKGKLIAPDKVYDFINGDYNTDYYTSIFKYNQEQYDRFLETGTVKGIVDVRTDKLAFDFDNKFNIDLARFDCLEAISRLKGFNIKPEDTEIYFSGNKGFSLVVTLPREITPPEAAHIAVEKIGAGLNTLDATIYNASRIFRVPGTRHPVSKLFKTPLTYEDLQTLTIDEIKDRAKDVLLPNDVIVSNPIDDLFTIKVETPKSAINLNMSSKSAEWRNCKWSILQGNFKSGERNIAMMILASTCRGLGFPKDITYDMCKGALRRSQELFGKGDFTKDELYNNILEDSVFTDGWQGGQYTCSKHPWLKGYCESLGDLGCKQHEEESGPSVPHENMWESLLKYAKEFEKNQIKTGLFSLDENIVFSTSTLNGLLGQPGSGKTAFITQLLKNASANDIQSMLFEMDMGQDIYAAKLIQFETGYPYKEAMELIKADDKSAWELFKKVDPTIKNIAFNYQSGMTVSDIRDAIKKQNIINGEGNEVRFVVIDYLECIAGPYSDSTANTGFIANQLKDLANQLKVCILLLLQTQKHSTNDVADPLLSLKGVKGSSLIEQSCSSILTLWREGYGPDWAGDDKYISFATVKNRFGRLWRGDFGWDGVKGRVSELTEEQEFLLRKFRKSKDDAKIAKLHAGEGNGWE